MPGRKPHSDDVIALVLRESARAPDRIGEILETHQVPLRTYQHWVRRFGKFDEATIRTIRELELRHDEAKRQLDLLSRDLKTLQEALGKPWRRSPSGGRPSDGPSDTPE